MINFIRSTVSSACNNIYYCFESEELMMFTNNVNDNSVCVEIWGILSDESAKFSLTMGQWRLPATGATGWPLASDRWINPHQLSSSRLYMNTLREFQVSSWTVQVQIWIISPLCEWLLWPRLHWLVPCTYMQHKTSALRYQDGCQFIPVNIAHPEHASAFGRASFSPMNQSLPAPICSHDVRGDVGFKLPKDPVTDFVVVKKWLCTLL